MVLLAAFFTSVNGQDLKIPGKDVLSYAGVPSTPDDNTILSFSDQGSWFSFAIPNNEKYFGGFSGPYIMTQDNGTWLSQSICKLGINDLNKKAIVDWKEFNASSHSYVSHLSQSWSKDDLRIEQTLFFLNSETAVVVTDFENLSKEALNFEFQWNGSLMLEDVHFNQGTDHVQAIAENGVFSIIKPWTEPYKEIVVDDDNYLMISEPVELKSKEVYSSILTISLSWSRANSQMNDSKIQGNILHANNTLLNKINAKRAQQEKVEILLKDEFRSEEYYQLISKAILTLQNNWRSSAGEFDFDGFFPSYHQEWFHGFWAWDSWKHSAAVCMYDSALAKNQIRAMFDFMEKDGFIPDCIFRNQKDEKHNYRNTKPPLSAWAIWRIYENDSDKKFLEEMFPQIIDQHSWWYSNRDHDKDGLCEFGSTDGTLEAAKWESGMDNAVRFDSLQILENSPVSYSLNQESVDLNSFLCVEKTCIHKMANELGRVKLAKLYAYQAKNLKDKIVTQFYDEKEGWFFDTNIEGTEFISTIGSEGWMPLWANIATQKQADQVKEKMLDESIFYGTLPFQTLNAAEKNFDPVKGYWRGPLWMDQSYFAVEGLMNYGFNDEAIEAINKLFKNADGVLDSSKSLRENYNPVTGAGLNAKNFSWTAAHILLLLTESRD